VATRSRRPGNLPAEVTSFVGRRRELADARKKLAGGRLVSLVGPGGVGKTRLAVRLATDLARGFRDGAWLVELGELREPALVSHTAMAALDLRDQAASEPRELLLRHLRDAELLLVVDNCEHLLDAAAGLIGEVLRAAPAVRVIATSQAPLRVVGEHVLPVPPLSLPPEATPGPAEPGAPSESLDRVRLSEAVRLFVERAAAASGDFALTDANRVAVVDLCRRLDGLPLAIELAAVRTRVLAPAQLLDRLHDRFALLAGGTRATLPRHETLRATLEWSYTQLTPAEQTLLSRLSVFAGRFTLDDVEAVCCFGDLPASQSVELVSSLLDKSLLQRETAPGTVVYRLHESMREYARSTRSADGIEQRWAAHYLRQCARFGAEGRYRLVEWLAWIEPEIDNVRALLLALSDDERGVLLATSLIWFWVTRATTEGVRWLDGSAPAASPWTYFARGFLAVLQSDAVVAVPTLARGVLAARAAGQPDVLCQLLAMAAIAANMAGDRASARRLLDEAAAMVADDPGSALMVHQARTLNALGDGDLGTARSAAADGAELSRRIGDLYSLAMMLLNQGFAALRSGDADEAERRFGEALPIARRIDDRVAQCYLLGGLGACAASAGDQQRAARLLGAMEGLRVEVGAIANSGMAPALSSASESVRASLGPARFESSLLDGRRMSRADALRLALREASTPSRSGPLGQRETDVARLVADGLSNKEIGARLFISERTVESHVRNILTKLGFHARTQIASWVAAPEG
jgi:predicted ATPase/DNA-binding CsgD family transcriptional regulator